MAKEEGGLTLKGADNITVNKTDNTAIIGKNNPIKTNYKPSEEVKTGVVDLIISDDYKNGSYTEGNITHSNKSKAYKFAPEGEAYAWSRAEGHEAVKGFKLKVITRTYFDKDFDKNFNFYFILTFSRTGQVVRVEGEFREDAFETTLHEHAIPLSNGGN